MTTSLATSLDTELKRIDAFGSKLPKHTSRTADDRFVQSLLKVQISPILINVINEEWHLMAGNRRLDAARKGKDLGGDGKVTAMFFYDLTEEEENAIVLMEGVMHTQNKAAQYLALKELMKIYQDWEALAEAWDIPVRDLKKMDRDWSRVPKWLNKPVQDGDIRPEVAIELGKKNSTIQEKAKEFFKENGKLVASDLKSFEIVEKGQVLATTENLFKAAGYDFVTKPQVFSRADLLHIFQLGRTEPAKAIYLLGVLMQELEPKE